MDNLPADFFLKAQQFTPTNHQTIYTSIDPTNPVNSLAGRVAIVTGASRGLGALGLAPIFAKAGVRGLVLVATDASKLQAVEKNVNETYPSVETLVVAADIADPASVKSLFEKTKAKFGHADILVNNAGLNVGSGKVHEVDPSTWWKNFEVNVLGHYNLVHFFIKSLPDPTTTPANIISLTTGMAWGIYPGTSNYSVSKLPSMQLNAYVASEYPNVTAIALHPGLMDTDMLMDSFRRFKLDPPDFVASVAVWLTSEKAKFMSGRVMIVNWDVDELLQKKEEIVAEDLLKIKLDGKLGAEQFSSH